MNSLCEQFCEEHSLTPEGIISLLYLDEIKPGKAICCPFPHIEDKNPSFRFAYAKKSGKLYYNFFPDNTYGDAIDFVARWTGNSISGAMSWILQKTKGLDPTYYQQPLVRKIKKEIPLGLLIYKHWQPFELDYWKQLDATTKDLQKFDIHPSGGIRAYGTTYFPSQVGDPTFAYLFDRDNNSWKTYKPYRSPDNGRHRSHNIMGVTQGYQQLPKNGSCCALTSSMKDIISWYKADIPSVAPPAEGVPIPESIVRELLKRFPLLFTNMNNDATGRKMNQFYQETYGLPILEIPQGIPRTYKDGDCSDPSDLHMSYGLDALHLVFNEFKLK